jgi:phosphopantetheinyl transferase
MEDLPAINGRKRLPVSIPVEEYLLDHIFNGKAVLPAVEEMRILAEHGLPSPRELEARALVDADFSRFLNIKADSRPIEAFIEMERSGLNSISLKLLSKNLSKKSGITRTLQHASLSFILRNDPVSAPPVDCTLGLEGVCIKLDKDRIYGELIPFEQAYRNIETLFVSETGALAIINGGTDRAPSDFLGSPFPLDASFHAACVWGQRYRGMTGFPVRIDRRLIIKKTEPGKTYTSRITPAKAAADGNVFDLWIYDTEGGLCEEVSGLHMSDMAGKSLAPPQWILAGKDKRLDPLKASCKELSLIELETVTAQCVRTLSPPERERYGRMREKRGTSYLGARLCLKKLSRRLSGNDMDTPADTITTIQPDGLPCCPLTGGDETFRCTASHDSRFAVAAASKQKIGIDVEEVSERVLKARHFYMHEEELSLVKSHSLGEVEASARVWTIKEAVSKATGMHLADAWQRTRVKEISTEQSLVLIDDNAHRAIHATLDSHLISLITISP